MTDAGAAGTPPGRRVRRWQESHLLAASTAGLVVLQGYVPLPGQVDITLWQIGLGLALPSLLVLGLPPLDAFRRPVFLGLGLLLLLSIMQAPASSGPALRWAAFIAVAIAAYLLGYRFGSSGIFPTLLTSFVLTLAPFAVLNVGFFAFPELELAFLRAPFARLLIEPDTLVRLFTPNLGNNVLAAGKAGTLFVNTNVASILFGFGLCVSLYRVARRPGPGRILLAALYSAAVLSTGSRAGMLAAAVAGVTVGAAIGWRLGSRHALRWSAIASVSAAAMLSLPMSRVALGRIAAGVVAADPRLLIWVHGATLASANPIRGIGFNGWSESFPSYAMALGLDPLLPPHNAYLIAWLWLGLAGLAAMTILFAGTLVSCARLTASRWLMDIGLLVIGLATWFGVQLFFTNFALLEPRVGGAFCLLLGGAYGTAEYRRLQTAQAARRVGERILET